MAHMKQAKRYGGKEISSDDDLDIVCATKKTLNRDQCIQSADVEQTPMIAIATTQAADAINVESSTDLGTDDEINVGRPYSDRRKGKRKVGERVEWSADEADDAYERFKNRAATKRKKTAETRKNVKAKVNIASIKGATASWGDASTKEKKHWGDEPEYELVEEEVPDYIQSRRKKFERNREKLQQGGLLLPPTWSDVDFSDDDRLEQLEERPRLPSNVKTSRRYRDIILPRSLGIIPASIAQYLRDYQIKGVEFLHELFVYQRGGILGDDMGLGKTVQVAAFLTAAFGKTGDERDEKRMRKMRRSSDRRWYPRALVICPGTLIENWKQELQRWGWWHVDAFHGDSKEEVLNAAISGRLEIVITTYSTYKIHMNGINLIEWDCVIADECHQMKERSSETTKAMNQINSLCRVGLSGTAIQNKYEELWTLLNWTNPGRFGPISQWNLTISDPLRIGQSHNATLYQLSVARKTAKKLVENLLPAFFIRRTKSLIAHELPKKSDRVVFCPLTDLQREAYECFLDSSIVEYVKRSSEPCDCASGKKRGWCCYALLSDGKTKWQVLVFPVIVSIQKLANHLALLIPNSGDTREKQERDLEFLQTFVPKRWQELYSNRDSLFNLANPEFCGKWSVLKKLLKHWHSNGDKVLVFSHSVRMLKMLQHLFHNTTYNVSFLDGSLSYVDRQKTVDNFNSDPAEFVFLISTKAGGVGLNITSANKVVIMDPNWNPSYDLQAQDRAYRIGQMRDVEVFRLVSAGTTEEIIYARQIYKQQQANIGYNASLERRYFKGIQNQKGQKGELFGLQNLLSFHGDSLVLRDIVNKTNIAEAKAGVNMVEVNMDDALDDDNPLNVTDGDEDAAISQLATLLTEEGGATKEKIKSQPKTDAIQAILASAGVEYTHENSEVVGSSKVEARLSRRAAEAGGDISMGGEVLFADSEEGNMFHPDLSGPIQYKYRPPMEVMKRQFCTMAEMFGFENATDFALIVEGMTQEQRRNCLDTFYRRRKERLAELADMEADDANLNIGAGGTLFDINAEDDNDDDEL